MLSGFFKSERSKYTGVIWHVKIKSLGRGHAHKNASDEVGRQMTRARGPRNTTVDFPALAHLRLCIAAGRSKDFDSQSRGAGLGQGALSGSWHCLSILCPATSPRPFLGDTTLQLQGCFILNTPVFYSYHTLPSPGVENLTQGLSWGGVHGFRASFTTECS